MSSPSTKHQAFRRLVAVVLVGLTALAAGAVATGRVAYETTNGVSMRPTYHTGDLVVVARANAYHPGQIVAYHAGREVILHRIIGGDATGYVLKGDSNQSIDPTRPTADRLIGRAVLHIPKVGAVLRSPISRGLLVVVVLALLGALMISPRPKPTLRVPGAGWTQSGVLTYHADVPVSDTYPTGEVVTGDPVFVKLLDTFGVSFRYTTDAKGASVQGAGRLDAALSMASGRHTSLPMAAPTPLVAGAVDLAGALDVARIQALAASVGRATGLGASTLDVIVTASVSVSVNGARPVVYTSRLPFQLTTFELALAGVKPSPSPRGPAVTSTVALNQSPHLARHQPGRTLRQIRFGLLAALVLCIGATIVVWPPSAGGEPVAA